MAVYREAFKALEVYDKCKHQIWNDACDEGVVVEENDSNYMWLKQLATSYADKGTRKVMANNQVKVNVTVIDEWAVSDERLSIKDATMKFEVSYYKFTNADKKSQSLMRKGHGFFSIMKLN